MVVIVLAFIFMRGDQLVQLAEAIQTGSPLFIILAILAQLGKYFAQGSASVPASTPLVRRSPSRQGFPWCSARFS